MDDFEKEYIKIVNSLKTIESMTKLFGEGEIFLSGGGTIIENIQKKIDKNIKFDLPAQQLLDFKILTDKEFKEKYNETKEEFQTRRNSKKKEYETQKIIDT